MNRIRALLVGLGQIGCGYDAALPFVPGQPRSSRQTLSHARALACHPAFTLVAGVDPSPDARHRFTQLYGAPAYPDLVSWQAAGVDPAPDFVVIAVSPQLQPGLVQTLLNLAPPRLFLLEKPVACDLQQARFLQTACSRVPQLHVAVNYIRRWLPAVQTWRQRLQAGELGCLLHGRIIYGKGLLSNGSHFVNLAEAWLGPLTPGRLINPGMSCFGFDREASLELLAADHGQAVVQVQSVGAEGLRAGELDLWFERGRLCWPDHGQAIAFWPRRPAAAGDSHAPLAAEPELSPTGLDHYQHSVMEALAQHLRDPRHAPLHCTLSDGVRTLETLASACADSPEPDC